MGENSSLVWQYFELLNDRRYDESHALLNDAGTWWSIGTRNRVPMAVQKEAFAATMGMLSIHFTLLDWMESGDDVLLELEGTADLPGGGKYEQVYCFKVTVWERTLLHVREYADTKAGDCLPQELLDKFRSEK
jgi:ketosteroid isomerase-like protein